MLKFWALQEHYLSGEKYFWGFKMIAKDSDQRTYFFFLPDEIINILKE